MVCRAVHEQGLGRAAHAVKRPWHQPLLCLLGPAVYQPDWRTEDRVDKVGAILNVELPHPRHLYWPDLDIDLAVESIEHPERFPLVSKVVPNKSLNSDVQ